MTKRLASSTTGRRINAMQNGAITHTKAKLGSVSLMRVLDAAEKASGWERGVPNSRGDTRNDLEGRSFAQAIVWLQQHLWNPAHIRWYDVVVWTVYMTHFFVVWVVAAVIWLPGAALAPPQPRFTCPWSVTAAALCLARVAAWSRCWSSPG